MSKDRDHDPPPDVALLLRAHSEQRWLSREVIPVVRQIETGERLPEEQLPAAVAYLEVIWAEAVGLGRETDAALRQLDALNPARQSLVAGARRYHASVRALRVAVARRVTTLAERGMLVETGTDQGDTRSARIPESASAGGACLPASVGASLPASVATPVNVLPEADPRDLVELSAAARR